MMKWGLGILRGDFNKYLEVVENKEYHCAHTPSTAKAKSEKLKWRWKWKVIDGVGVVVLE